MSSSVSSIIQKAEQDKLRLAMAEARQPKLTNAEIMEGLRKQISGKVWWLEKFGDGKRFPRSEVETKRLQLAELVQARDLIRAMSGGTGAG